MPPTPEVLARRHAGTTDAIQTSSEFNDSNPIGRLLESMVQKGLTNESAAAMEKLVALYERLEDRAAERQFNEAFARLQAEIKPIEAKRAVNNSKEKGGGIRYVYASFEDIAAIVRPILERHQFSYTFDMTHLPGGLVEASCTMIHGGHSRTNKCAVHVGTGPGGTSPAQADGAARTYARRLALCDALGIPIERDNDAAVLGDYIDADESAALVARVERVCKGDKAKAKRYLSLAKADDWSKVRRAKYDVVCDALDKAEPTGATTSDPADVGGSPAPDESQAPPELSWAEFKPLADAKAMSLGWSPSELDTALAKAAKAKGERSHLAASAEFYAGFLGAMGSERMDKLRK